MLHKIYLILLLIEFIYSLLHIIASIELNSIKFTNEKIMSEREKLIKIDHLNINF